LSYSNIFDSITREFNRNCINNKKTTCVSRCSCLLKCALVSRVASRDAASFFTVYRKTKGELMFNRDSRQSKRRARRPILAKCGGDGLPSLVKLQVLRLLVPGGYITRLVGNTSFRAEGLARALGLMSSDDMDLEFDARAARHKIRELYAVSDAAELETAAEIDPEDILATNLQALAEATGLSPLAKRLLALVVHLKTLPALASLDELIGPVNSPRMYEVLSVMLNEHVHRIRDELSPNGILHQSGLLRVDRNATFPISIKLDLISTDFAEHMIAESSEPLELLRGCVSESPTPELEVSDFEHMPLVRTAVGYLQAIAASSQPMRGVNILIHGAPGLGKTQLARVVATQAGLQAFEVAACAPDMRPINGDSRLSAYRAAQRLLKNRTAVLIFDEFEDVSDLRGARFNNTDTVSKGSLNELLESNQVPTIFITNAPHDIDRAHLRRFSIVIEAKLPSLARRRELLRAAAGHYINDNLIDTIIEYREATAAIVKRAASVVDTIDTAVDGSTENRHELFCEVLGGILQMQTQQPIDLKRRQLADVPAALYDASLSNADIDLVELANELKGHQGSRILLYGAPGTGKTAFGRWLAHATNAPLLVRRASDLLDAYVGNTEKLIAQAFKQAQDDGAVLLIDECDSFLRTRGEVDRPWQQTMTNELLTQIEAYQGVLVLTTNLMNSLDEAVMRRIDHKIKLDYLKPAQLGTLLRRYCERLGINAPSEICLQRVGQLTCVAPGDFAVVARQARLRAVATPDDFVERLSAETNFKRDRNARRPIGFLAA
jgi:transitional endoplasmic reticulum ATPase